MPQLPEVDTEHERSRQGELVKAMWNSKPIVSGDVGLDWNVLGTWALQPFGPRTFQVQWAAMRRDPTGSAARWVASRSGLWYLEPVQLCGVTNIQQASSYPLGSKLSVRLWRWVRPVPDLRGLLLANSAISGGLFPKDFWFGGLPLMLTYQMFILWWLTWLLWEIGKSLHV